MTMSDSFPVLDPRDRVPVQAGPPVKPQKIEPPQAMKFFWPSLELAGGKGFTQEMMQAQVGRVIKVSWGEHSGFKARVKKVEPRGSEGAEVTLERVPDDTPW
jgi:hypothetical protein